MTKLAKIVTKKNTVAALGKALVEQPPLLRNNNQINTKIPEILKSQTAGL